MFQRTRVGCLTAVVLALGITAGCSSAHDDSQETDAVDENLAGGLFVECEVPGAANKALDGLIKALHQRGIDLGAEVILVYDHDLATGHDSVEILVGGAAAWAIGNTVGQSKDGLRSLLTNVHANAGLLAGLTVPIPFDGDWRHVKVGLDAFWGADVGPASGGRWKLVWSSDPGEVGLEGFWASLEVAKYGGVCGGGGIVFGTDQDVSVISKAWRNLISGGARPLKHGSDTLCNRGAAYENIERLNACIDRKQGNAGSQCLFDGSGRYRTSSGSATQLCGLESNGNYSCDVDRLTECLRSSGGKACFDTCTLIRR